MSEAEQIEAAPNGLDLDEAVDALLDSLKGYQAKFNRQQSMSVVDLASRQEPGGTKFRQLFVKQNDGNITVSLVESFKSAHGGNEQRNELHKFQVSVSDAQAYRELEGRFFLYNSEKNAKEVTLLVDELKRTVSV